MAGQTRRAARAHYDIDTTESEIARPLKRKAAEVASSATSTSSKRKARETSKNKTDEPSTSLGDADSPEDDNYADQEIARLKDAIADWEQLFLAEAPGKTKTQKLPSPLCSLIGKYCPKDGRLWRGGLIHWLRSGSALPIIKLWIDAIKKGENLFALLKKFLPLKEYPWRAQLKQVTELAKLPDAGRSKNAPEVIILCAIYTRKPFLGNHAYLLDNGTSSADFVWHRILDVPCAALFTAYHDLVAPKETETFFGTLLDSPLALPMHVDVRTALEKKYALPEAAHHPSDTTTFFSAAAGSKLQDFMPPPPPPGAIDHHAYYVHDPFSEKEQLLFWIAYQDETKTSSLFGIDYKHIAELLPGRCEQEIAAFFKLNKVNLGLESERRVVVARDGEEVVDVEEGPSVDVASPPVEDDIGAVQVDNTASVRPRGFGSLQAYVPPPRPAAQPPLSRTNVHPDVLSQLLALDQALGDRNEADLALAGKQVDLEDAQSEQGESTIDSLKVQLAWYERDEAKALLAEKKRVVARVQRELVLVRAKCGGDEAEKTLVCENEVVDLEG